MKRFINILLVCMLASGTMMAQPRQQRGDRIHAIKVGYITDKVHLTAEQAGKFWPIYNRYEDEHIKLRRSFFNKYPDKGNMHSEQAHQYVEDNLDYQEAEVQLKRKYQKEFTKVLSATQLAELYQAERDFKKMLVRQLRENRNAPTRK